MNKFIIVLVILFPLVAIPMQIPNIPDLNISNPPAQADSDQESTVSTNTDENDELEDMDSLDEVIEQVVIEVF